ncbi:MAG: DNA adenine methylase [Pyrinomonadaceae bacterium]
MSYTGGKNGSGVYQKIISMMPPHRVYIEAFLGNGAILRNKKPAEVNFGIELDEKVLAELWTGAEIPNLDLINADALEYLTKHFPPLDHGNADILLYCDPPYLKNVRRAQRQYYRCDLMTQKEHEKLLHILRSFNFNVMISGYYSKLYNDLLSDWRRESFTTTNRAGHKTTEFVWLNFPKPLELHDYRFLGADYRKREDLKRKKLRWKKRLTAMPSQERFALMATIEELKNELATA